MKERLKKYKRILLLMAFILAAGMVSGCGGSNEKSEATEEDSLSRIKEKGKIVIATEGNWIPWSYGFGKNGLTGFDVELARLIADKLEVKPEFIETDWDSIFEGLDSGKYDIAINGIGINEKREQKYIFSKPYAYVRPGLFARADDETIKSFEDLKGKTTEDTPNSTFSELAQEYGAKDKANYKSLDIILEHVEKGQVDATVNADVSYYFYKRGHPKANIKLAAVMEKPEELAIPMVRDKKNESLREAINDAIDELRSEGKLSDLSKEFFNTDATIEK